jgi:hypothetical protein
MAEMGRAARAFAETQTWPAMMDEVIMVYTRLIEARRAAGAGRSQSARGRHI